MRRTLLWLWTTLAALTVGFIAAPAQADIDRSVLLELSASVLKIEVRRVQGGFSLGSGVVVAPEKIVTNCHVTRDAAQINVLRGGVRWVATAQLSDIDRDLCLLRVPKLEARAVALGRADSVAVGQPVAALGFTGGMGMQSSSGEVLALHRFDGGKVIQSSNWFSSGASGGGLFDEKLQLVGILTFRLRGGEAHYFAAPSEWLRAMLDAPAEARFRDVAPETSDRLPYWQRPMGDQPLFLRAALMQRDDRWPELRSLASEWVRTDSDNAEPWYLLGVALSNLNRSAEAREALGCSMAIDPVSASARERLASSAVSGAPTAAGPGQRATENRSHPAAARPPSIDTCSATAALLQNP